MSRSLLSRAKDAALQKAVRAFLKPKLDRYGELKEFDLDTSAKRVTAEVLLHGDSTPLVVTEALYRLEQESGEWSVVVYGVKTSKPWVQHLLEDYFPELKFKVPELVKTLIS
jgi:hypothetical protein